MQRNIDREEFNEILDAVFNIKRIQGDYMRDLQLVKRELPDSRIAYRFIDFKRNDKSIDREAAKNYVNQRIKTLDEIMEQIITRLENDFCDRSQNLRGFFAGDKHLKMTNPTTKSVYLIIPSNRRLTLYVVLLLERRVNEGLPICRSDYEEMRKFFKKNRCGFPKELFNI